MSDKYPSKEARETAEFEKWGKLPPTVEGHGTDQDIRENMKVALPTQWRLEGNQLIGQTELGKIVQTIPTDYILHGTTDDGLPDLRKVVL